jgi:hypothetical protein
MSSSSYLQAASAHGTRSDDKPMHNRFFIGPMPEKVLSQTEAQVRKKRKRSWLHRSGASPSDEEADRDSLSGIIQEHALQFFISQGGNEEDWGDNEQESVRQEMLRRWKDSEWGSIWKRRMQKTHEPTSRWVGGSFEIGKFLGVNTLDEAHAGSSRHSTSSKGPSSSIRPVSRPTSSMKPSPSTPQAQLAVLTSTSTENNIVTAPSEAIPSKSLNAVSLVSAASAPGPSVLVPHENANDIGSGRPISDSSTTPLLVPDPDSASLHKARSEVLRRPFKSSITHLARSDGDVNGISTPTSKRPAFVPRKSKTVHYRDSPMEASPPAPPTVVLARTGSAVQESSAGATEAAAPQGEMVWGDVVMRGWPHSPHLV